MTSQVIPLFLSRDDLETLTGKKTKSAQIRALKSMLIPFRVNALGDPVVTRSAVEGTTSAQTESQNEPWKPRLAASR